MAPYLLPLGAKRLQPRQKFSPVLHELCRRLRRLEVRGQRLEPEILAQHPLALRVEPYRIRREAPKLPVAVVYRREQPPERLAQPGEPLSGLELGLAVFGF